MRPCLLRVEFSRPIATTSPSSHPPLGSGPSAPVGLSNPVKLLALPGIDRPLQPVWHLALPVPLLSRGVAVADLRRRGWGPRSSMRRSGCNYCCVFLERTTSISPTLSTSGMPFGSDTLRPCFIAPCPMAPLRHRVRAARRARWPGAGARAPLPLRHSRPGAAPPRVPTARPRGRSPPWGNRPFAAD